MVTNQPKGMLIGDAAPVYCDMEAVMLGMVLLLQTGVAVTAAVPEDIIIDGVLAAGVSERAAVDMPAAGDEPAPDGAGIPPLGVAAGVGLAAGAGAGVAAGIGTGVLPTGTVRTVEIGVGPQTWQDA